MGESMAEILYDETEKIFGPEAVVEESVSFGKFGSDSLSWDRWSSFSQNKYMEEAEKCSTPGSVAEKKAYFEAHYKKIAAQKTESLQQEQQMEGNFLRSDEQYVGKSTSNGCESELKNAEFDQLATERISYGSKDPNNDSTGEVICSANINEPSKDGAPTDKNCLLDNATGAESDSRPDTPKLTNSELVDLVKEEKILTGSEVSTKLPKQFKIETNKKKANKPEESRPKREEKQSVKKNPASKEKNMARANKKPALAIPKLQHSPIPRTLKITTAPHLISASRISTKKGSSSVSSSEKPSVMETKKASPTSLPIPLSLGSSGTDTDPPTSSGRASIMEKMGDKEIVKRAFKTFRNSFNLSNPSTDAKSSATQQVFTKGTKQHVSATTTPRKYEEGRKNIGGTRKAVEKASPRRGDVGPSWQSASSGPPKSGGGSKASTKPTPSTFYLRSNERAEKRSEFFMKLVENSNAKEVEKSRNRLKSMEDKEREIKKLRQSLNFKATPMPDFYQENGVGKIPGNKEGVNYGSHPRLESHRRHEIPRVSVR